MKVCTFCKIEKEIIEFHKDKKRKDGLHCECKECRKRVNKYYGQIVQPKIEQICIKCNILKPISEFLKRTDRNNNYRTDCKKCRNKYIKEYKKKNHDKFYKYHLEYGRKHRPQNREKYRQYVKNYRIKYPERRREYDNKRHEIPYVRVKRNLRSRLRNILRKRGAVKSNKTMNLIGCSVERLMIYLQSLFYDRKDGEKMTIELMSTPVIELDHIIPLWKFDLTNPEEQKRGFHYTNMRPMWTEDHNIKSAKDYVEYCEWKRSGLNIHEYLNKGVI